MLCIKLKYSEYNFSYTILQNELYQNPGKGNVIAVSVITITPVDVAFTFTRYWILCILNVLSIYVNYRKIVDKMYIQGALMSKSYSV